jgi:hypothetical protein
MVEPGLGQLDLLAVLDFLAEHAVDIADAVAMGRHINRRHGFHEAGSQPPQAAIAQRCIRLQRFNQIEINTERRQCASRISSSMPMLENASRVRRPIKNSSDR